MLSETSGAGGGDDYLTPRHTRDNMQLQKYFWKVEENMLVSLTIHSKSPGAV
jgi:hypothetical protein